MGKGDKALFGLLGAAAVGGIAYYLLQPASASSGTSVGKIVSPVFPANVPINSTNNLTLTVRNDGDTNVIRAVVIRNGNVAAQGEMSIPAGETRDFILPIQVGASTGEKTMDISVYGYTDAVVKTSADDAVTVNFTIGDGGTVGTQWFMEVLGDTNTTRLSGDPAEYEYFGILVTPTSSLVGKAVNTMKVRLHKTADPVGTITFGVYGADRSPKYIFGTAQPTALQTINGLDVQLSNTGTPYVIQADDRICVRYSGSPSVVIHIDAGGSFDGENTVRARYNDATGWTLAKLSDPTMGVGFTS